MRFLDTEIHGAFLVELEPYADDRGLFARAFCVREFEAHGVTFEIVQANISANKRAGTVRGLHWQSAPALEPKFFRCIKGSTHHVIVDMRSDSTTYRKHIAVDLSAERRDGLIVPAECATGYQALEDGAEVMYLVAGPYSPEHEKGLRFDDPTLHIEWPLPPTEVSEKDRAWPLLDPPGEDI